jgi:hypothetical protein
MRGISVNINDNNYKLFWSKFPELIKYANLQINTFPNNEDDFFKEFEKAQTFLSNRIFNFIPNLDKSKIKKIVSVGSGIGTTELLLLQYFNNAEIFLVDKDEITRPEIHFDGKATPEMFKNIKDNPRGFFNSWEVTKDAIQSSNLDQTKIHFLNTNDDWPNEVDLIISSYAWCWSCDKEAYWDRLLKSLNIDGWLMLDIYRVEERDIPEEISNDLGSLPFKVEQFNIKRHSFNSIRKETNLGESQPNDYFVQFFNPDKNGVYGGTYSWVRRK